ncbi:MAG: hypothetical protein M4579_002023 [Chaenotheca gracillima]|nr:MAG: hypothetical protein M4579_002023 [Chaenotheca gracillima]
MFDTFRQQLSEACPPTPAFTEKDVSDLSGKVYLITGATAGIGLSLAGILYSKNARIYMPTRSPASYEKAVAHLTSTYPDSKGSTHYLALDLSDLRTIKPAVSTLLAAESVLHTAFYNAGVMNTPRDKHTAQDHELQWGTNVLGHFLLNKLLTPLLVHSASVLPTDTVRTVWVSSDGNGFAPGSDGGINWADPDDRAGKLSRWNLYGQSKAADIILGYENAQRLGDKGVLSLALNPGHLKSDLVKHTNPIAVSLTSWMLYEPRFGALTELFAGFTDQVSTKKEGSNGSYIIPWGRLGGSPRKDVREGYELHGTGARLWEMCEKEVKDFA